MQVFHIYDVINTANIITAHNFDSSLSTETSVVIDDTPVPGSNYALEILYPVASTISSGKCRKTLKDEYLHVSPPPGVEVNAWS